MTRFQKTCISLGLALGAFAAMPALAAPEAAATVLMTKDLADMPGKEAISFIYVLEGSIVMGVKGGKEVTLTPGQTFYEGPADIHTVGRNASATKPAKFLVTMVKDKGAPLLTLVK